MNYVDLTGYIALKPKLNSKGNGSYGSISVEKPYRFRRDGERELVSLAWIGEKWAKDSLRFDKGDFVEIHGFLQSYQARTGEIKLSVCVTECSWCGHNAQAKPLDVRELLDQDDPELQNEQTEESPKTEPLTAEDVGTEASSLTTDEKTIEKKTRKGARKAKTPKVERYQPPEDLPGIDFQPFS